MKIKEVIPMPPNYSAFEPIGDGVILSIAREDVNEMVATAGGILVPKSADRANNPIQECLVVAAGPECKQIKAGDLCQFNLLNAPAIPAGDVEIRFTQEPHVLCITKKAPRDAFPIPVAG